MPRPRRIILDGIPVHHILRGNDRRSIFADDRDRTLYRSLLIEGSQRFGCSVHAYVLMSNHVHLLLTPPRVDSVARFTQWMGRQYVGRFNRRHGRTGTLWEGRFRSSVIDSARYFIACSRYIDLNPVRAGLVALPSQYSWSSYARLGLGQEDSLVSEHPEYERLGETPASRQQQYRELCAVSTVNPTLDEIRRAVQRGEVLGGEAFQGLLTARLGTTPVRHEHGGDRRSRSFRTA